MSETQCTHLNLKNTLLLKNANYHLTTLFVKKKEKTKLPTKYNEVKSNKMRCACTRCSLRYTNSICSFLKMNKSPSCGEMSVRS